MELDVYFESVVTAQPILGGIESLHGYIFFKKALMGGGKGGKNRSLGNKLVLLKILQEFQ